MLVKTETIKTNPKKLKRLVAATLVAGLVPMVWGPPGMGKSEMLQQIADALNLKLIDMRLSQLEPGDLMGLPYEKDGRTHYAPPRGLPLAGDSLPVRPDGESYDGWLLFLDELNHASRDVTSASYKLMLDRKVGDFDLHPSVHMAAAGNRREDRAMVNDMPTAQASRIIHYESYVDADQWLNDYALPNDLDKRITAFIQWKPELLMNFDPNSADRTFGCPRTWSFTNRLISVLPDNQIEREMVAGTVGTGCAHEFLAFVKRRQELPTLKDIIADPEGTPVPEEADLLYSLVSTMTLEVDEVTSSAAVKYLSRVPRDYQLFFISCIQQRNQRAMNNADVGIWLTQFYAEMSQDDE